MILKYRIRGLGDYLVYCSNDKITLAWRDPKDVSLL